MNKLVYESDFDKAYDELSRLNETPASKKGGSYLVEGFNLEALHEGIGDKLRGLVNKISAGIKSKFIKDKEDKPAEVEKGQEKGLDIVYAYPEDRNNDTTCYRYERVYWANVHKLITQYEAGEIYGHDLEQKVDAVRAALAKKYPDAVSEINAPYSSTPSGEKIYELSFAKQQEQAQALKDAGATIEGEGREEKAKTTQETNSDTASQETTDTANSDEHSVDADKNAKRQASRQNNSKILKALKAAGIPIDSLMVKNGVGKMKASAQLNNLRKALFGESLEEEFDDEEIDIDL